MKYLIKLTTAFLFFFIFFEAECQVTSINPSKIVIDDNSLILDDYYMELFNSTRAFKVNKAGHILMQNNYSTPGGTDFWHFGVRDGGDLDVAFGTPSSSKVVGTSNALMTFKQDGKVGIGTANPDERLSVQGDLGLSAPSSRINFYDASSIQATLKYNASRLELENNTENGDIQLDADGEIQFMTNLVNRMEIESDGDVSIGASVASAQLEIWDNSNSDHPHLELYETGSGDFARLRFRTLPSSLNYFTIASNPGSDGKMNFFFFDDATNSGSNIFTVEGDDKRIGINKTNPEADLHIAQNSNNNISTGIRFEDNDGTEWNIWVDDGDDFLFNEGGNFRAQIENGTGDYVNTSDRSLKENIQPMEDVLEGVLQLRPSWYNYKNDIEKQLTLGFIAQEVEEQFPGFVKDANGYKALAYDYFAVLSIKGIQELNNKLETENTALKEEVTNLEDRLTKLEKLVAQLASADKSDSGPDQSSTATLSSAELEQNQPNPFSEATTIHYFIPEKVRQAEIRIATVDGKLIKTVPVQNGRGQLTLDAYTLQQGTYIYTLILDGKMQETRRMILTR